MNFSRMFWLLAVSVVAGCAQTRDDLFTLHVYVDDVNQPLAGVATPTAKYYAGTLLANTGVTTIWRRGLARSSAPDVLQIRFAPETPREYCTPEKQNALAMSFPYAEDGTPIVLFSDRISPLIVSFGPRAGIVLGYVMAHEIGHMLEGVARHSEAGVMRATWTSADFASITREGLPFTNADRKLIRMGIEARQKRQALRAGVNTAIGFRSSLER